MWNNMIKRFSIFVLVLCMVLYTASCTNNKIPKEESITETYDPQESVFDVNVYFGVEQIELELPGINIESDVKEGVTKAETATSSYEFYGRTEEENINLAIINEIAISVLRNAYDYSPPKGRLIHFIGEKGIYVSEYSLEVQQTVASNGRTVMNPDSIYSVGALFYGASRNLLPGWLAAGLELYWPDKFGIERFTFDREFDVSAWQAETTGLPVFGDVWFEWYDYGDTDRLSIAFSFVKWLDENELLDEIVRTYLADEQTEGDLLFANAWQKFTGQDIRGDFRFENRFRHLYGKYLQTNGNWDCYIFSVLTEQGHYLLDRSLYYLTMEEYFNNIDKQYAYAKQWLGFEDDNTPIPTRIPFERGGSATAGAEYVSLPSGNSLAPVHEAFHHLLFSRNIFAEFQWFNESLPEAIGFIYGDENPGSSYAQGTYYNLTGKNDYNSAFDFTQYTHIMALEAVNYFKQNDRYGSYVFYEGQYGISAQHNPSDFTQGYLNTTMTSASFVLYMLERGSREDFMKLYTDISAAEEVYGADFDSLYEQWLEFLTQI